MYAKASYHDAHYVENVSGHYEGSAKLLARFLPKSTSVLDYGCGIGLFLKALKAEGFSPTGVEFDQDAADYAARIVGCPAFAVQQFVASRQTAAYDALHLGDVLEHLPDPAVTLRELLPCVKPGGLLFVEGPLEINPSPVYWVASVVGAAKKGIKGALGATMAPTHLLRVAADQQLLFFSRVDPRLSRLHWDVHETGWPYASGGAIKRAIAGAALLLGGKTIFGTTFGNRFRVLFRLPDTSRP